MCVCVCVDGKGLEPLWFKPPRLEATLNSPLRFSHGTRGAFLQQAVLLKKGVDAMKDVCEDQQIVLCLLGWFLVGMRGRGAAKEVGWGVKTYVSRGHVGFEVARIDPDDSLMYAIVDDIGCIATRARGIGGYSGTRVGEASNPGFGGSRATARHRSEREIRDCLWQV